MNEHTYQIYDRIIKKILLLSSKAVIHLINGLFDTAYPAESNLTYNWTEHVDNALNKRLSDTILTINGTYSYHIEAQIVKDGEIAFRVFEYGYHHALKHHGTTKVLKFPAAKVIYLCENSAISDTEEILLDFGRQGSFTYQVETFKLMDTTIQELHDKKMIILIPFLILRFKKKMQGARTPELINELQTFILHDIIKAIQMNVDIGNITESDAFHLRELTLRLYREVFTHYKELKEGGVNDMLEDDFVLDVEILEEKIRQKEREKEEALDSLQREHTVNLYRELQDVNRVAYILKLPAETVQKYLNESD